MATSARGNASLMHVGLLISAALFTAFMAAASEGGLSLVQIALFTSFILLQYAGIFGCAYLHCRFAGFSKKWGSEVSATSLKEARANTYGFFAFAAVSVFVLLLVCQLLVRDSWLWPFTVPVWIGGVAVAFDLAIMLSMKGQRD